MDLQGQFRPSAPRSAIMREAPLRYRSTAMATLQLTTYTFMIHGWIVEATPKFINFSELSPNGSRRYHDRS